MAFRSLLSVLSLVSCSLFLNLTVNAADENPQESSEDLLNELQNLRHRIEKLEAEREYTAASSDSPQSLQFRWGLSGELFVFESSQGNNSLNQRVPGQSQISRLSPLIDVDLNNDWTFHSRLTFSNGGAESHFGGTDQKGSVFIERAYFKYSQQKFELQFGHLGLPFGFFNQGLDPQSYYGARPSEIETELLPGSWNEAGLWTSYQWHCLRLGAGVFNSLNAVDFRSQDFLRSGRQNSQSAATESPFFVGRLECSQSDLQVGFTYGQGTTNHRVSFLPDIDLRLFEVFARWRWRRIRLEALLVEARVSEAEALTLLNNNETFGSTANGWTWSLAYQIPIQARWGILEAFYQWTSYNLHSEVPQGRPADLSLNRRREAVGFQYSPLKEMLIKMDYFFRSNRLANEKDQLRFNLGFLF